MKINKKKKELKRRDSDDYLDTFNHGLFNLLQDYPKALPKEKLKILISSIPQPAEVGATTYYPRKSKSFDTWKNLGFLDLEKLFLEGKINIDFDVPVTYEWFKGSTQFGLSCVCGQINQD